MLHLNIHFFLSFHRIEDSRYVRDGPSLSLVIGIVAPIVLVLAAAFICAVHGIRKRKRKLSKKYHLFDFFYVL